MLQTFEELLHELDDEATPVDAASLIEETKGYLSPEGAADAAEEEAAEPTVEDSEAETSA